MKQTFVLPNRLSELIPVLDRLESLLFTEGAPTELVKEVRIIAEEGISNIIYHAYEGSDEHKIEVTLAIDSSEIRLELRDNGKPFDPTEMPEPDSSLPIEEQTEGGLGIHLMKTLSDELSYVREGDHNILMLRRSF